MLFHHFPTRSCVPDVCENDKKVYHHFRVAMFTEVVAALRAAGRTSRAIYSKNFLDGKGSISDQGSISDKGRMSDKGSMSYIISPQKHFLLFSHHFSTAFIFACQCSMENERGK